MNAQLAIAEGKKVAVKLDRFQDRTGVCFSDGTRQVLTDRELAILQKDTNVMFVTTNEWFELKKQSEPVVAGKPTAGSADFAPLADMIRQLVISNQQVVSALTQTSASQASELKELRDEIAALKSELGVAPAAQPTLAAAKSK